MNQFLFGVIALLMLAIVGVGATDVLLRQQATTPSAQPAKIASTPKATPNTDAPATPAQAPGTYTLAQIAQHDSAKSCYSAIDGGVYDLTSFIGQHPGGSAAIMSLCGVDGSSAFNAQHGGQGRPERELASLKIGTLTQ